MLYNKMPGGRASGLDSSPTNACMQVYGLKLARLPCWLPRVQQESHQRWIWEIHCMQAINPASLAFKPRADVTRSPKQGYQWPYKNKLGQAGGRDTRPHPESTNEYCRQVRKGDILGGDWADNNYWLDNKHVVNVVWPIYNHVDVKALCLGTTQSWAHWPREEVNYLRGLWGVFMSLVSLHTQDYLWCSS